MAISILPLAESNITLASCLKLIKTAFEEREKENLHYPCMDFTLEEYASEMSNHQVFVAIDPDNDNPLIGVTSVVLKSENSHIYALEHHSAVRPGYKGKGIGSMLMSQLIDYSRSNNCDYILATTAKKAAGAIAFHRKNGFQIIRSASYPDTGYYSVVMRKQLKVKTKYDRKWVNPLYCKLHYLNSTIRMHMMKNADGSYSLFGKTVRKLLKRK